VISGSFGANLGANVAKFVTSPDDGTTARFGSTVFDRRLRRVPCCDGRTLFNTT